MDPDHDRHVQDFAVFAGLIDDPIRSHELVTPKDRVRVARMVARVVAQPTVWNADTSGVAARGIA